MIFLVIKTFLSINLEKTAPALYREPNVIFQSNLSSRRKNSTGKLTLPSNQTFLLGVKKQLFSTGKLTLSFNRTYLLDVKKGFFTILPLMKMYSSSVLPEAAARRSSSTGSASDITSTKLPTFSCIPFETIEIMM